MSDHVRASADATHSQIAGASVLLDFIRKEKPWFTPGLAEEILQDVPLSTVGDPKELARHLQHAFAARNLKLKLSHAQQAIARVLGHSSWHRLPGRNAAVEPRLMCRMPQTEKVELHTDWTSVRLVMQACVSAWAAADPTRLYWVGLVGGALVLTAMEPRGPAKPGETVLVEVTPVARASDTLTGATTALEGLRRFIEHDAILDGVAALSAHLRLADIGQDMLTFAPIGNAELVVLRNGAEIARGDEYGCWLELDHALRIGDMYGPALKGDVVLDGGTWRVGDESLTWHLFQVGEGMAGVGGSRFPLSEQQSATLYSRYLRARRIFKNAPPTRGGKQLIALKTPDSSKPAPCNCESAAQAAEAPQARHPVREACSRLSRDAHRAHPNRDSGHGESAPVRRLASRGTGVVRRITSPPWRPSRGRTEFRHHGRGSARAKSRRD